MLWLQTHKLKIIQSDVEKSMEESYVRECFKQYRQVATVKHIPH